MAEVPHRDDRHIAALDTQAGCFAVADFQHLRDAGAGNLSWTPQRDDVFRFLALFLLHELTSLSMSIGHSGWKQASWGTQADYRLRGGSLREEENTIFEWMCSFTTILVSALPWRRLSLADVSVTGETIKKGPKTQDKVRKTVPVSQYGALLSSRESRVTAA